LRVGIAGAGFIGTVHARAARLARARLVGVAASSLEHSEASARRLGADRPFESAEALVESPDVDVVHVCTPNHLHLPLAEAALLAGKHVICEKPLALDLAGAKRLTELAGESGRHAFVPFVYRYHPMVREARERVHSGRTGSVRLVHGSYLQDWLASPEADNWRVDAHLGGASRAFADIGSHWCDLAEFVTGHRIVQLSARTLITRASETEDAAVVQFETDRGAVGSAVISQLSAGRKNRLWFEIDGSEESLAFDQEEPERLWCGRQESATLLKRDPAFLSDPAARLAWLPAGHAQGYGDCFAAFVADAYAAIRGDAPEDGLPAFADGLRTAVITDAVLAAARDERWIDVPTHEPAEVAI
ncbi:MAG TPA: Gfo/Idh/MocA family oxidoreductase, partial [Solirubrobacteraceae bacterium]|nr:Gfo/Idh/MocA family oxidoreductase [Solirubrobacteraceae bacterium]